MIWTVATVSAGVVGGVYAAFSLVVMPALDRLGAVEATAAMRSVNRVAERGPFIGVFGVAAAAAVALVVQDRGAAALVVAGGSLAGTAVTVAVNVPLNRRLDRDGAAFWPRYRRRWTAANTVRAVLSLAALVVGVRGLG